MDSSWGPMIHSMAAGLGSSTHFYLSEIGDKALESLQFRSAVPLLKRDTETHTSHPAEVAAPDFPPATSHVVNLSWLRTWSPLFTSARLGVIILSSCQLSFASWSHCRRPCPIAQAHNSWRVGHCLAVSDIHISSGLACSRCQSCLITV